jgi:quercetin dioxygenase-like cupin family protein
MAYIDPRLQGIPAPVVSVAKMESGHTARLERVKGSDIAFLDQKIPAYRREIINIIGMGVTENVKDPDLAPKITAPAHGFTVTYVRAPQGCGAALHRHPTEEVFLTLKGKWEIYWLEGDSGRSITLDPGDIVNVPIGVYRGFRNASADPDSTLTQSSADPIPERSTGIQAL